MAMSVRVAGLSRSTVEPALGLVSPAPGGAFSHAPA
jgi:hypothetical protein